MGTLLVIAAVYSLRSVCSYGCMCSTRAKPLRLGASRADYGGDDHQRDCGEKIRNNPPILCADALLCGAGI
jgi:hypothetical protein